VLAVLGLTMTAGPNSFPDRLDDAEAASAASDRARASACAAVVAALDALMRSSVLKDATTRVLVAFSGGLDSTVLLHAAVQALGAQR
jgi:asparagine synthetase B (glutamine-hydrolysing)